MNLTELRDIIINGNDRRMGIPSFCSAEPLVIEALIEEASRTGDSVLIEATSNQVNPDGGYIGMDPAGFRDYVNDIAERLDFPKERIILGGDHLGPLPWQRYPAAEAMERAEELVRQCVTAGYRKIHIDTTMTLADDDILTDEIIAVRSAMLYRTAEDAYEKRRQAVPSAEHPIFVIGSEVPPSGGAARDDQAGEITGADTLDAMLDTFRDVFHREGLDAAWEHIVAVVVEPGVEFCRDRICEYDRHAARELMQAGSRYSDIVFEGHSTDFQPFERLQEMVEDGISIIKVGPELTFALREALFALDAIEAERIPAGERAELRVNIRRAMDAHPETWDQWYQGSAEELNWQKDYSYLDRSRYVMREEHVAAARHRLFRNLDRAGITDEEIRQYMPLCEDLIGSGASAEQLSKEYIKFIIRRYRCATSTADVMVDTENGRIYESSSIIRNRRYPL